jgi:hypothetical protein
VRLENWRKSSKCKLIFLCKSKKKDSDCRSRTIRRALIKIEIYAIKRERSKENCRLFGRFFKNDIIENDTCVIWDDEMKRKLSAQQKSQLFEVGEVR